jgi:hypothetical protein
MRAEGAVLVEVEDRVLPNVGQAATTVFEISPSEAVSRSLSVKFRYRVWDWTYFPTGCLFRCATEVIATLNLSAPAYFSNTRSSERGDFVVEAGTLSFETVVPSLLDTWAVDWPPRKDLRNCPASPNQSWEAAFLALQARNSPGAL